MRGEFCDLMWHFEFNSCSSLLCCLFPSRLTQEIQMLVSQVSTQLQQLYTILAYGELNWVHPWQPLIIGEFFISFLGGLKMVSLLVGVQSFSLNHS